MPRFSYRLGLLASLLVAPSFAAAPDAAASPILPILFIAPSGEPFRAAAGAPYPVAAWFAGADANHDGKLTSGEFLIDMSRFFDSLDLDHNQQLGSEEIKRYETEIAPEVRSGGFGSIDWDVSGGKSRRAARPALGLMQVQTDDLQAHVPEVFYKRQEAYSGSGGSKYGIIAIPEPVMAMDTDLNGIVSRQEMLSAAQRRFRILDTDEKNYLVLSELPEPYAQSHPNKVRKKR